MKQLPSHCIKPTTAKKWQKGRKTKESMTIGKERPRTQKDGMILASVCTAITGTVPLPQNGDTTCKAVQTLWDSQFNT